MRINILVLLFFISYNIMNAQCGNPDASIWNDTWQSCQVSQNPNADRGEGHWIQYDFGAIYTLSKTHVWNTNEAGKTQNGFRNVTVDYSEDGVTWQELGSYEFLQGTEDAIYGGFEGFDFEGKKAQYVIITATSNWGGDCFGIAEVKFNLLLDIEAVDIPCDDPPCDGECDSVTDIQVLEIGEFHAWLAWEAVEGAEGYLVIFRIVGEEDWDEIEVEAAEIYLDELDDETEYEFLVLTICEEEEESEESESIFFTTLGEETTHTNEVDENGIAKLFLVPNPAQSKVSLIFESNFTGSGLVHVRNVNGSLVDTHAIALLKGKNNNQLSVNNLANGVYFITLENRDRNALVTQRLVVMND